jgi:hypothetical protein
MTPFRVRQEFHQPPSELLALDTGDLDALDRILAKLGHSTSKS